MKFRASVLDFIILFAVIGFIGIVSFAIAKANTTVAFPAGGIHDSNLHFAANTIIIGDKMYLSINRTFHTNEKTFIFSASAITIRGRTFSFTGDYVALPKNWNETFTVDGNTYEYVDGKTTYAVLIRIDIGMPENKVYYETTYTGLFALASGPYLVFFDKPATQIIQDDEGVKIIIVARIKFYNFYAPMYTKDNMIFVTKTSGSVKIKNVTVTLGEKYVVVDGKTFTVIGTFSKVFFG